MTHRRLLTIKAAPYTLVLALGAGTAGAQEQENLAQYFGFAEPRTIVVGPNAGPAAIADMNGDGLNDLVVANNSRSRIEIHLQRAEPLGEDELRRNIKANELPPSPYYERVEIGVSHRVTGFRVHDIDGDGLPDIIYAGQPAELVVLRQSSPMRFEVLSRRRVAGLSARQGGIEIADVMGDPAPELLAIVAGKVHVFGLSRSAVVGEPTVLGSDGDQVAFFVEDFNGDGLNDVLGAIPDHESPLRLWLQEQSRASRSKDGQLGPELRFEMPALVEAESVRFPDRKAASIVTIERATRRIVLHDLATETVSARDAEAGERDARAEVFALPGTAARARSVAVADINADGLLDLIVTDQQANSLVFFPQESGVGLSRSERVSTLKDPKTVAVGQWDTATPTLEVFVLSEADKAVGVSAMDPETGRFSFPAPLPVATEGAAPVAMAFTPLSDGPAVSVIVRDRRDHTLELHRPGRDAPATLKLEGVNRPPESILAGDFDHDGTTDLLLFTPGEPLVMVRSVGADLVGAQVLTDKTMPQFGLVQAAGPGNTALLDIDGDNRPELLIADQNFVRACSYDPVKGWRVIEQITLPEAGSVLSSLTVLDAPASRGGPTIVAYDRTNKRLVLMARSGGGAWEVVDRLRFTGMEPSSLAAGAFTGDDQPSIMAFSANSFALVRLAGQRISLNEVSSYRSDSENRFEHEIEVGDLNSDGFVDMVVLDAREQMAQLFSFSATRRMVFATEFSVFESRLFRRGDTREFEPRTALIGDVTGSGANDLVLEVHDRYIVYPQMTRPE